MEIKITLLVTILAYSFIVSQSFMYVLALKNVQYQMNGSNYVTFRQLTDASMRNTFKYALYIALLSNLLLVIITLKNPGSLLFIIAVISLVALITDILLTVKGNLPINDVMNGWTPESYPQDWTAYRKKWFTIFQYRQVANIIGFVSLIGGVVFKAA